MTGEPQGGGEGPVQLCMSPRVSQKQLCSGLVGLAGGAEGGDGDQ